jgi:hypothetical protein
MMFHIEVIVRNRPPLSAIYTSITAKRSCFFFLKQPVEGSAIDVPLGATFVLPKYV